MENMKKVKIIPLIISALMFFLLVSVMAVAPANANSSEDTKNLTILFTNDLHGYLNPLTESTGGVAYVARIFDNYPEALKLSAGDIIDGGFINNYHNGVPCVKFMNMVRYDAMVMGNHELSHYERDNFVEYLLTNAEFPVIGANIKLDGEAVQPYVIKTCADGLKVGIIGVCLNTEEYKEGVKIDTNYTDVVRRYVEEIESQTDITIALIHGYKADIEDIAKNSGVDICIGGHEHVFYNYNVGNVPIFEALCYGQYVGKITVTYEAGKISKIDSEFIPVQHPPLEPNLEVKAIIDHYEASIPPEFTMEIANITTTSGEDLGTLARRWKYLGEMTDSIRMRTGADIAFDGIGGARNPLPLGTVCVADVHAFDPFGSKIITFKIKGSLIKEYMEEVEGHRVKLKGYEGYLSGISLEEIKDEEWYTFSSTDFIGAVYFGLDWSLMKDVEGIENIVASNILKRDAYMDRLRVLHPLPWAQVEDLPLWHYVKLTHENTSMTVELMPLGGNLIITPYVKNPVKEPPAGIISLGKYVNITMNIPGELVNWPESEYRLPISVKVKINYTEEELAEAGIENELLLRMYYWDNEDCTWYMCPDSGVNVDANLVVAKTDHLTIFAPMSIPTRTK